ncbi:MAG: DUF3307 domain-containing protein [Bacteroidota bacterium]
MLQPQKWVADKVENKAKSKYLYYHILVHTIVLLIVLQFQGYWLGIVIIILTHFVFDLIKVYLNQWLSSRILFFTDQLLHLFVIAIVVYIYEPFIIELDLLYSDKVLLTLGAIFTTTFVISIVIKVLTSKWSIAEDQENESLKNAGAYIGMLERLFVLAFVIFNQWSAIGFLLAAKSVFRFGDLSKAKDRKLTEYILIGTLLSFGFAIIIALVYKNLLNLS